MAKFTMEALLLLIVSVDEDACIRYSVVTGKYYVSHNIYHYDGTFRLKSEHKYNIKDAVESCYKEIQGKKLMIKNTKIEAVLPILI